MALTNRHLYDSDAITIQTGQKLVAVTNRHLCEGDFLTQIQKIAEAGFDRIILREKDLSPDAYKRLAEQVLRVLEPYETICTLHNFLEVAVELQAKEIHLPLSKLQEKEEKLSLFSTIGVSIHSNEQLAEVEKARELLTRQDGEKQKLYKSVEPHHIMSPAVQNRKKMELYKSVEPHHIMSPAVQNRKKPEFYVTAGHIFPTDCKKGVPARGLSFLREICQQTKLPVYAIGGISPENLEETLRAGADGACVMSYCMRASERELKALVKSMKSLRIERKYRFG